MKISRSLICFLAISFALPHVHSSVRADEPTTPAVPTASLNLPGVSILTATFNRDNQTGNFTDIHVTGPSRFTVKKVTLMPGLGNETGMRAYLTIDDFSPDDLPKIVVKVKDKLFGVYGYGGDKDRYWSIDLRNVDAESSEILSGGKLESAPKENLQIDFSPYQKTYKVGDKVKVGLSINNVGKEPLKIYYATDGGGNYHCRDLRFAFTATRDGKQVAANPEKLPDGFASSPFTIEPDSFLKRSIDVSEWLLFDQPGTYQIDATYTIDIFNPKTDGFPTQWAVPYKTHFIVEVKP